ncbi:hypothetical protein [Kushneria phosphatilytica]|nr:hypothetical protein [Kushneria phosphatilytica]
MAAVDDQWTNRSGEHGHDMIISVIGQEALQTLSARADDNIMTRGGVSP